MSEVDAPRIGKADPVEWRLEQLIAAGYTEGQAVALAEARDVDLHKAVGLLANGCDPETAFDILT